MSLAVRVFLYYAGCAAILQLSSTITCAPVTLPINTTLTVPTTVSSTEDPCLGWQAHSNRCYQVFGSFEYFSVAQRNCKTHNAHLATISSKEENEFLQTLVRKSTRYSEAWIGYKYNQKKVLYEWVDGTKSKYKNWIYNRPGPEGYCVEIIPGGKWNNLLCNNQLQYVCERGFKTKPSNKNSIQIIILVSIPLSCVFLMVTFVGYLWVRSVHQLAKSPPEDDKGSRQALDTTETAPPATPKPSPSSSSIQNASIDANKSDATDKTVMQLYRNMSSGLLENYTTIRGEDGIYRKVTLV